VSTASPTRTCSALKQKTSPRPPGVVDAVNAVDVSALSAAFARESNREIAAEYGDDGVTGDEASHYAWEVSPVDRCLAWLAGQADGPVSYWSHDGDHGLVVEEFTGYGAIPAAWRNRMELQGPSWDNSRPRCALTAALWHVGFQSRNFDECEVFGADTLAALYGEPTDVLHIKRSTPGQSFVRLPKFLTREGDPNNVTE